MAYQSTIPQPTDRLRTSQGDLLGNFAATSGGLGTMLNPNQGYIQFPNQGGNPTFTGAQPGFFAKTAYGVSEIFVNRNIVGPAQQQIPFTASTLSTTAVAPGQHSWFFLPSGYLVKTGFAQFALNAGIYTFTYPVNAGVIPVFTTIISTQLTLVTQQPGGPYFLQGITTSTVNFSASTSATASAPTPVGIMYFAVGVGA